MAVMWLSSIYQINFDWFNVGCNFLNSIPKKRGCSISDFSFLAFRFYSQSRLKTTMSLPSADELEQLPEIGWFFNYIFFENFPIINLFFLNKNFL
jgi:hypothetical protein